MAVDMCGYKRGTSVVPPYFRKVNVNTRKIIETIANRCQILWLK